MRKIIAVLLVMVIAVGLLAGCVPKADTTNLVGVSMPTKSLQRWNQDGANMKASLEKAGYTVDLQYADNDIPTQVSQVENMIASGSKVIVLAPIDGGAFTSVLQTAKEKGVKIISYDRLILNSDAVSYYATFDNYKVGQLQGQYIIDQLDLTNQAGPFNMEMFTGSPDDNNINFFFGGAIDTLQPYIDNGKLRIPSGQTSKNQVTTLNWNSEVAQTRMEDLITAQGYGPTSTKLDVVLSSNDSVAQGITNALRGAGYTKDNFPLLTGQDADKVSMKNMKAGLQTMSIFKDTRMLADKVVTMVDALMKGTEPEINDTKTYNNGTGIIPSYLLEPVIVTIDNYKEILIDSGYYTEAEIS